MTLPTKRFRLKISSEVLHASEFPSRLGLQSSEANKTPAKTEDGKKRLLMKIPKETTAEHKRKKKILEVSDSTSDSEGSCSVLAGDDLDNVIGTLSSSSSSESDTKDTPDSKPKKTPLHFRIRLRTNDSNNTKDRPHAPISPLEESSESDGSQSDSRYSDEPLDSEPEWIHPFAFTGKQKNIPGSSDSSGLSKHQIYQGNDNKLIVLDPNERDIFPDPQSMIPQNHHPHDSMIDDKTMDIDSLLSLPPEEMRKFSVLMNSAIEQNGVALAPITIKSDDDDEVVVAKPNESAINIVIDTESSSDSEASNSQLAESYDDSPDIMTIYKRLAYIPIGVDHPELLAESATLSSVELPATKPDLVLRVPIQIVKKGWISNPQLECLTYAARCFTQTLASGHRKGYYLGEGTGCGKGRVISATVWHLWNLGYRRHVWLSVSNDLAQDAIRDLRDSGAGHIPLIDLGNVKLIDLDTAAGMREAEVRSRKLGCDWNGEGILFCTYTLLARNVGKDSRPSTFGLLGSPMNLHGSALNGLCDIPEKTRPVAIDGQVFPFQSCVSMEVKSRLSQVIKWMSLAPPWARKKKNNNSDQQVFCEHEDWDEELQMRRLSKNPKDRKLPSHLHQFLSCYYRFEPENIYPGGLLIFDEAHKAKNLSIGNDKNNINSGTRGKKSSSNGAMVDTLQELLPHCTVLYASATGASEPRNMAYMGRLGLWGPHTNFETFQEFKLRIDSGGFPAMECLAMDLKSQGMYSCRTLSYYDISFTSLIVPSTPEFTETYDLTTRLLQRLSCLLNGIANDPNVDWSSVSEKPTGNISNSPTCLLQQRRLSASRRKANFWSVQQRVFKQLLVSHKVHEAVRLTKAAIAEGRQVVISLWGTGESRTSEKVKEMSQNKQFDDSELAFDDFLSPPKLMLEKLLEEKFPLFDYEMNPIEKHQLTLDTLKRELQDLDLPKNPLDELIALLGGPSVVAEMSGRTKRLINDNGRVRYVSRDTGGTLLSEKERNQLGTLNSGLTSINVREQQLFQSGKKSVAIITEAASAGISLHCDRKLANPKARLMICIELPWAADKAIQQFGRIHRSNQRYSPSYSLLVTDVGGERRFVACIARRMKVLGAITRGDRRVAFGGKREGEVTSRDSEESHLPILDFDIYSQWGFLALGLLIRWLRGDRSIQLARDPPAVQTGKYPTNAVFCEVVSYEMNLAGMELDDSEGGFWRRPNGHEDRTKMMDKFLNRMLLMPLGFQKDLFDFFSQLHDDIVEAAKSNGDFDKGVENLNVQHGMLLKVKVLRSDFLCQDPNSGSNTSYYLIQLDRGISWGKASRIYRQRAKDAAAEGFYWYMPNSTSKRMVALVLRKTSYQAAVGEAERVLILKPNVGVTTHLANSLASLETLRLLRWTKASDEECADGGKAREAWIDQYKRSKKECNHIYIWGRCRKPNCRVGIRYQLENMLTGNIIGLWNRLESWLKADPEENEDPDSHAPCTQQLIEFDRAYPKRLRLVKAVLPGGVAIVGAKIPASKVQIIKRNLELIGKEKDIDKQAILKARAAIFRDNPTFFKFAKFVIDSIRKHVSSEGELLITNGLTITTENVFSATDHNIDSYNDFNRCYKNTFRAAFQPNKNGLDSLDQLLRVISEACLGVERIWRPNMVAPHSIIDCNTFYKTKTQSQKMNMGREPAFQKFNSEYLVELAKTHDLRKEERLIKPQHNGLYSSISLPTNYTSRGF